MGHVPRIIVSQLSMRSMSFLGKVGQVLFQKAWEINALMKRKDSNCVWIISDQGENATASNLSEYTIKLIKMMFSLNY